MTNIDIKSLNLRFQDFVSYQRIALAVSGGADSIALLHLLHEWKQGLHTSDIQTPDIVVLTVDHGLREEAHSEAEWVKDYANTLGYDAEILNWVGEKPDKRIQEKAREARYELLVSYCSSHNISILLVAHHLDDQAETVLMRLARGTGVDGLGAMADTIVRGDVEIYRPLLDISKQQLVDYLKAQNIRWVNDPSNDNQSYERVRVRQALEHLEGLGIDAEALGKTAKRMRRTRKALDFYVSSALDEFCHFCAEGYCRIDFEALRKTPDEIVLRCLNACLQYVRPTQFPLQLSKIEVLWDCLINSPHGQFTLTGSCIEKSKDSLVFAREVRGNDCQAIDIHTVGKFIWDRRFVVDVFAMPIGNITLQFLTEEGYLQIKESLILKESERTYILQKNVRQSLPAFYQDNKVIAVPHVDYFSERKFDDLFQIVHHSVR